jgi:hypothetical protein
MIKEDNNSKESHILEPVIINNYTVHNEETSLVEIWLTLAKHKKMFFLTFLLSLVFAAFYILTTPETYTYKTNITIGTQAKSEPLQPPNELVAYLDDAIIPKFLSREYSDNPKSELSVSASNPKKMSFITLLSNGTIAQKESITEMHRELVESVAESHQVIADQKLSFLNGQLSDLEIQLSQLSGAAENHNELLSITIFNLEDDIRSTKQAIANFTPTHSVTGTVRSTTADISRGLLITISVIIALCFSLLAVLFSGFIVKVKEHT